MVFGHGLSLPNNYSIPPPQEYSYAKLSPPSSFRCQSCVSHTVYSQPLCHRISSEVRRKSRPKASSAQHCSDHSNLNQPSGLKPRKPILVLDYFKFPKPIHFFYCLNQFHLNTLPLLTDNILANTINFPYTVYQVFSQGFFFTVFTIPTVLKVC